MHSSDARSSLQHEKGATSPDLATARAARERAAAEFVLAGRDAGLELAGILFCKFSAVSFRYDAGTRFSFAHLSRPLV